MVKLTKRPSRAQQRRTEVRYGEMLRDWVVSKARSKDKSVPVQHNDVRIVRRSPPRAWTDTTTIYLSYSWTDVLLVQQGVIVWC